MRSLADQSVEELGGRRSILHRQTQDHIKLNRMLERLPTTSDDEQDELLHRLCRLVFTHAFAEEAVLWPALRRSVEDGEELTARVEREHQEITELVAALEQSSADDAERRVLMDRTIEMLRQDVRDEEDVLLPRLQEAVDVQTLRRLGVSWELVRRIAPTRTHPIVSRRPPGQTLSALPLSITDRLRDGLDHLARRVPQPARSAFSTASDGVGAVIRRIGKLPPLRRGERPDTHVAGRIR
jgi:hemerythrin-like domain-containing protein